MEQDNQTSAVILRTRSIETLLPAVTGSELAQVHSVSDVLAITDSYPTLARLRATHGEAKTESLVKAYLLNITELVNLKRPLNEGQINAIAKRVVATYYTLTAADLHLIFERALNGEYGEFYDALDVPKVMRWFASYFNERCSTAYELREATRVWDKGGNITSEDMRKRFNNLEKSLKK